MNAATDTIARPQLSLGASIASRAATALGVAAFLAGVVGLATQASQEAVQTSMVAITTYHGDATPVTLPTVEVIGPRQSTTLGAGPATQAEVRCADTGRARV